MARQPPLTYIDCADVGFPSSHVASLCNCCCRPESVLFRVLVGIIASHTHASRVNFSAALRFPGSRVACSALRSSVVIRQCTVFCRHRLSRRPYTVLYYYFVNLDVSNSGALSFFSARSLAVNTQQYFESEQLQVRLTSAVHDDIGNIILRSHNAQISISSWPGNRHKI